ncbi:uncharacterized protein KQ657_000364 [Scheffersomyces spartinae]|uniref:Hikeshi-like domain-containing protein n=1 Tax=Scheffersomyces spartinae TaxID=45513 RepID=A0A9P8AHS5_9ASCO|nr:uncharacterized protein KQ657_000364 [Scheffersomyces spartinae]KAG7193677.1 hypothetical protein KQ657_000364 [Scheffersomyces spartinae]
MFGAICSGRPMQLATQMDQTKFVISIPQASKVQHVVVFILPNSEFIDPNYTALVYFQFLVNGNDEYRLLGGLNPMKPSAIYKLNGVSDSTTSQTSMDDIGMMDDNVSDDQTTINIGISIEPTLEAERLLAEEKLRRQKSLPAPPNPSNMNGGSSINTNEVTILAKKIVGHAYNYLGSFLDAQGKVPMKAFDNWWDKFKHRLNSDPKFIANLENSN